MPLNLNKPLTRPGVALAFFRTHNIQSFMRDRYRPAVFISLHNLNLGMTAKTIGVLS